MENYKNLLCKTKANDVDEKGVVTVAVNGIGVKDSQDDISMPGSFNKTLKENFNRMRWFLNHRTDQLLGVPLSGEEKENNLVMVGRINLKKQMGRDTLEDYKLYAENGRTLEHSIGVKAIKRDESDRRKVKEWFMGEYSTLTAWGSNPQTFLVDIKSATNEQVKDAIEFIRKSFHFRYSDERLNAYDMQLNLMLKALSGAPIVTCPHCGYEFNYDDVPEVTYSQQVLELAAQYHRWITEDIVREEMNKLTPQIREQVIAILDTQKMLDVKSMDNISNYVRCPHCWARVYKSNAVIKDESTDTSPKGSDEPLNDTQTPPAGANEVAVDTEKAADTSTFFHTLNDCFVEQ